MVQQMGSSLVVHLPVWALVLIIVWFTLWSILGPWLGVKICSSHWQCPIKERKRVEAWQLDLEKSRAKS